VALIVHVNSIKDLDSIVCEPSQSARQSDVFLNRVFLAAKISSPWQQWPVIDLAFHVFENLLLGEYIENRAGFYLKSCSFVGAFPVKTMLFHDAFVHGGGEKQPSTFADRGNAQGRSHAEVASKE
jgi:hypothetical protein